MASFIFTVGYDRHSSTESERVEFSAIERALFFLGLLSNLAFFDASWSPRGLSDKVVRIVTILGANFNLPRLYTFTTRFGNSIKVSVDDTPFGEELGSATKHRYS